MIAARCGGVRVVSVYAPNGRMVGSPFYAAKLAWYERLARWLARGGRPRRAAACSAATSTSRPRTTTSGTRAACHGGTHVSPPEREAFARLCRWGLVDAYRLHHPEPGRYTWWDYRAGRLPQELRHAHRPPARDARRSRARDGRGRDRPRGAQGQARSRPTTRRCSSTSTSPAAPSTPAGPRPRAGSPRAAPAERRARASPRLQCTRGGGSSDPGRSAAPSLWISRASAEGSIGLTRCASNPASRVRGGPRPGPSRSERSAVPRCPTAPRGCAGTPRSRSASACRCRAASRPGAGRTARERLLAVVRGVAPRGRRAAAAGRARRHVGVVVHHQDRGVPRRPLPASCSPAAAAPQRR